MYELKQIPDYPAYAVTKDGRVWSYKNNRFLKPLKVRDYYRVKLYFDGMIFCKNIHRLVYETFTNSCPEFVIHLDGNGHNNELSNLKPMTRVEHNHVFKRCNKKMAFICRVNPKDGTTEKVPMPDTSYPIYSGVLKVLSKKPKALTCRGYIYYYEGKKHRIVDELKARIKYSTLLLRDIDEYSPFKRTVKKSINRNKKLLEALESA